MSLRHLPILSSFPRWIASVLVLIGSAGADELPLAASVADFDPAMKVESESAPLAAFHHYAHTLHELTERRRSTVHFQNEQSILRGAQVGFVNVGEGNLTFGVAIWWSSAFCR